MAELPGAGKGVTCFPDFGISVDPISTSWGDRLCPYLTTTWIFFASSHKNQAQTMGWNKWDQFYQAKRDTIF